MSSKRFFHPRARKMIRDSDKTTAKEVRKIVRKEIRNAPEPKNHYTSAAEANIDWNGSGWVLFNPAQGDTSQTREGDRATQMHLSIRGRCVGATSANSYNALRVIVFYWKADTGERTPAMDDVIQASYLASANAPYGPLVVGQSAKDIQIVSDRLYDVAADDKRATSFHINKKINKKCYFNATATTGQNQLYMFVISDDGVTAYPRFSFVSNVTFKDL